MSKKPQALSKKEDAIFAEAMQLSKLEKKAIDEKDKNERKKETKLRKSRTMYQETIYREGTRFHEIYLNLKAKLNEEDNK